MGTFITTKWKTACLASVMLLLSACATTDAFDPTAVAKGFGQGFATITEVSEAAGAELRIGALSVEEAETVSRKLDAAYGGLVLGEAALGAGQTGSATAQLDMVIALLTELQKVLPPVDRGELRNIQPVEGGVQ